MPFPFVTPTTSHLTLQANFVSTTHPSLPTTATSRRNIFRAALKSYKRLSTVDQANNLSHLVNCLLEYLTYLHSINAALSSRPVSGEDIDIALTKEVEVEWRPTLSSSVIPGKEADRVKGRGLDYEIYFAHHTLAILHNLAARQSLLGLYAAVNPTSEQRVSSIQAATRSLRTAYTIHAYLNQISSLSSDGPPSFPPNAIDIGPAVQRALQRLTAAEMNLLAALKDDPYPALLLQSRNESDKEWMIKAPTIPKVRAQVLTRLCVGAAEHAIAASASLKEEGRKVAKDLVDYVEDVRRTARARACRFQAVDCDLSGETGRALAWLFAALNELGVDVNVIEGSHKTSKLNRLKSSWNERKEDRRIAKADSRWGIDGGKAEEGRILEYLERRYSKENSTINIQVVPDWRPLAATLPSGMNLPVEEKWKCVALGEDDLTAMRAPPEDWAPDGESSGEDENIHSARAGVVGAFPIPKGEDQSGQSYY